MTSLQTLGPARSPARPGPGDIPQALLRKVDLTVRLRIDGNLEYSRLISTR